MSPERQIPPASLQWSVMRIDLRVHKKLYHSLYCDVFSAEGRVYKLYKASIDPHLNERALTLFEAQSDAYSRAASNDIFKKHTAEYFGQCTIESVVDSDGQDISGQYSLESCYSVELLHGPEAKVNSSEILDNFTYVAEMRRHFRNFGIDTEDSSVFSYTDPARFKFIDITTTNF